MTPTTVAVLTPPGGAAVAVLAVRGPAAWPVLSRLFRTPGGRRLEAPPASFAFGRFGEDVADEILLVRAGPEAFEVHCHGGPQVLAWLVGLLRDHGLSDASPDTGNRAIDLLPFARTVRTAGILLDQAHGAYDRATAAVSAGGPEAESLREVLRRNVVVGKHLVEPWQVAIAGAPNAGKSSLLNALAGFARSIVSPIPGTTRDAVSAAVAFDGWPVTLIDTAGLRDGGDDLEMEGIGRARAAAAASDLVLWVVDATGPRPRAVGEVAAVLGVPADRILLVLNKADLVNPRAASPGAVVWVSATTGAGLADLIARLVATIVPAPPAPGEPVPFTPEQCACWSRP